MKRCVAIQHVAFENLGVFVQPLEEAGFAISYVQAGVVPMVPELWKDADLAVVLGGPIGVYQDDLYPFLADEKALVASRLASGRPLLGICLGAQLMASALDANVYPGTAKEIGWGRLSLRPQVSAARWPNLRQHRCCTGTAIPMTCQGAATCWLLHPSRRIRHFGPGRGSLPFSSMPKWTRP